MAKKEIEELAFRCLNGHPNDKSNYHYATLRKRFGITKAKEAITQMAETLLLCDPDHKRAKNWLIDIWRQK